MFAGRFFAARYFPARYFAKVGENNAQIQYGYFPHNFFARRYYTNSYFPGSQFTDIEPPVTGGIIDYIVTFRRRRR